MFKRFWAFITRGKVVYLEDFDGELTRSIAYPAGEGVLRCFRMFPNCKAVLKEGGEVTHPRFTKKVVV